jgi:hypothetical protein
MQLHIEFKTAIEQSVLNYQRLYVDSGNVMPLLRSADVLAISQHCAAAQLASELRMAIEAVVHQMKPLSFIERLFGVSFCPLKKSLLKTLSSPVFQLLPMLAKESQYLLKKNQAAELELQQLRTVCCALQPTTGADGAHAVTRLGQLEQQNEALLSENAWLSRSYRKMQQENQRLQQLLNDAVLMPDKPPHQQSVVLVEKATEEDCSSDADSLRSVSSSLGFFMGGLQK